MNPEDPTCAECYCDTSSHRLDMKRPGCDFCLGGGSDGCLCDGFVPWPTPPQEESLVHP